MHLIILVSIGIVIIGLARWIIVKYNSEKRARYKDFSIFLKGDGNILRFYPRHRGFFIYKNHNTGFYTLEKSMTGVESGETEEEARDKYDVFYNEYCLILKNCK